MKHSKSFLTLALMASFVPAFSTGVVFEQGVWTDVITKAKKENKSIFVDAYTDWCGWCKVMDKETFPDKKLGGFFKEHFISYKMNMEVGEGIKMAMKYHVRSYPTYLIFSPEGTLLYKVAGYQKPDDFLKTMTAALDKSNQMNYPATFEKMDLDYPEFYKLLFDKDKKKRKNPSADEVAKYLDSQSDLFSEVNWNVMCSSELNDKYRDLFLSNISKYKELYGAADVNDKVNGIIQKNIKNSAEKKDKTGLAFTLALVDKYVPKEKEQAKILYQMNYYRQTQEWTEYAGITINYVEKNAMNDSHMLNQYAWDFYENISDKQLLARAEEWAKKSIELKEEYANSDTYACVLYKLGKKEEAMKAAVHAIELGKKENVATKETESLLEKIKLLK